MNKYIIQSRSTVGTLSDNPWKTESLPITLQEADDKAAKRIAKAVAAHDKPKYIYRIIETKENS